MMALRKAKRRANLVNLIGRRLVSKAGVDPYIVPRCDITIFGRFASKAWRFVILGTALSVMCTLLQPAGMAVAASHSGQAKIIFDSVTTDGSGGFYISASATFPNDPNCKDLQCRAAFHAECAASGVDAPGSSVEGWHVPSCSPKSVEPLIYANLGSDIYSPYLSAMTDYYMLYDGTALDFTATTGDVQKLLDQGQLGYDELCAPLYPSGWDACQAAIRPRSGFLTAEYLGDVVSRDDVAKVLLGAGTTIASQSHGSPLWALATGSLLAVSKQLAKEGFTAAEICELGSEAPGASHTQRTSTSNETNACLSVTGGPGSQAVLIQRGLLAMRGVDAALGVGVVVWILWRLLRDPGRHAWPAPFPDPDPQPIPQPCLDCGTPPLDEITLVAQRITETFPSLDPVIATRAARTCVEEEMDAGDNSQPCLSKPLFFPGLDAVHAAQHDAEVITAFPAWFQLTYESRSEKKDDVPESWYNRNQYKQECGGGREIRGVECDEYPFYTTVERGPSAYSISPLVLKEVPAKDNGVEGTALGVMQDDPNCQMATVAGPSGKGSRPRTFPGSKTQQYIVIPMILPISLHVCINAITPPSGGGGTGGGGPVPS